MKIPKLPSVKLKKSTVILLVALSVGLLAAFAARSYLSNRMQEIEVKAKGRLVDMVVAKVDLDKGAVLDEDSVAVRPIPEEFAHASGILPQDFDKASGERLAFSAKAGQILIWSMLESKKAPTFSTRVEVGRRAMTVPVDEISSISGMLEPGDIIDLIVTVDREGQKYTLPLLQGVTVMATGQRSPDDPESANGRREYSTVTLDTTPEEAKRVIAAREGGKITALLRNPQDNERMKDGAMQLGDLLMKGRGTQAGVALGDGEGVPILYGGTSSKFTPEQLELSRARGGKSKEDEPAKEADAKASSATDKPSPQGGRDSKDNLSNRRSEKK